MKEYSIENLKGAREINTSDKDYLEGAKSVQMETDEHFRSENHWNCGYRCPFEGLEYLLTERL